jgi:hypothetical protein
MNGRKVAPSSHMDLVGIFDSLKEILTGNYNKRLNMFRTMITLPFKRREKKYQTQITTPVLTKIFMVEAYCKNAKPCEVIAKFFHNIKIFEKYQTTLQDFGEYKHVYKEFANDIASYDDHEGWSIHVKTKAMSPKKVKERDYQRGTATNREQVVTELRSDVVSQVLGSEIGCHRLSSTNSKI